MTANCKDAAPNRIDVTEGLFLPRSCAPARSPTPRKYPLLITLNSGTASGIGAFTKDGIQSEVPQCPCDLLASNDG